MPAWTRLMQWVMACGVVSALSAVARACPSCNSQRAREVRDGLMDDLSPQVLAAIGLPFVVTALLLLVMHHARRWRRSRP